MSNFPFKIIAINCLMVFHQISLYIEIQTFSTYIHVMHSWFRQRQLQLKEDYQCIISSDPEEQEKLPRTF